METVVLGTDHAGFDLKEALKATLRDEGFDVVDVGACSRDEDDDYPTYVIPAAEEVAMRDCFGVVLGGSGQGEAIAANKVEGVRAVVYYGGEPDIIELSRRHNDANVLSLGARFLSEDEATDAVLTWLHTDFSGAERHERRIEELSRYERGR